MGDKDRGPRDTGSSIERELDILSAMDREYREREIADRHSLGERYDRTPGDVQENQSESMSFIFDYDGDEDYTERRRDACDARTPRSKEHRQPAKNIAQQGHADGGHRSGAQHPRGEQLYQHYNDASQYADPGPNEPESQQHLQWSTQAAYQRDMQSAFDRGMKMRDGQNDSNSAYPGPSGQDVQVASGTDAINAQRRLAEDPELMHSYHREQANSIIAHQKRVDAQIPLSKAASQTYGKPVSAAKNEVRRMQIAGVTPGIYTQSTGNYLPRLPSLHGSSSGRADSIPPTHPTRVDYNDQTGGAGTVVQPPRRDVALDVLSNPQRTAQTLGGANPSSRTEHQPPRPVMATGASSMAYQPHSAPVAAPAYRDVRMDQAYMASHSAQQRVHPSRIHGQGVPVMANTPMMTQNRGFTGAGDRYHDQLPRPQESRIKPYELKDNIFEYIHDFEVTAECNGWSPQYRQLKLYDSLTGHNVRDAVRNIAVQDCTYPEYVAKIKAELKPSYDDRHYKAQFFARTRDLRNETPVEFWRSLYKLHKDGWSSSPEHDRIADVMSQFKHGHPAHVRSAMVYGFDKETLIAIAETADPGRNIKSDNHDTRPPRASQIEVGPQFQSSQNIDSATSGQTPSEQCEINKISYDTIRKNLAKVSQSVTPPLPIYSSDPEIKKLLETLTKKVNSNYEQLNRLNAKATPNIGCNAIETFEEDDVHGQCLPHLNAVIAAASQWKRGSDNFGKLPDRKRYRRSADDRENAKGSSPGAFRGTCYFCMKEGHPYGRCITLRDWLRSEYNKHLASKDGPEVPARVFAMSILLKQPSVWATHGFDVSDSDFPVENIQQENE